MCVYKAVCTRYAHRFYPLYIHVILAVTAWLCFSIPFVVGEALLFLVAESFTKKMAYSWKSWVALLVSICSALYVHKACGDCPHIDEFWVSLCFYLCWVKTIGGVLLKLLEYCYMNEYPHDKDCSP